MGFDILEGVYSILRGSNEPPVVEIAEQMERDEIVSRSLIQLVKDLNEERSEEEAGEAEEDTLDTIPRQKVNISRHQKYSATLTFSVLKFVGYLVPRRLSFWNLRFLCIK